MTHDDDRPRRPATPTVSLPAMWRGWTAFAAVLPTIAVVMVTPASGKVAAAIVGAALLVGHAGAVVVAQRTGPIVAVVWSAIVAATLIMGPRWIVDAPLEWVALPVIAAPVFAGSVAAASAGLALAAAAGIGAAIGGTPAPWLATAVLAAVAVLVAVERRRGEARSDALARREVELAALRAELQQLRGQHDDREAQQVAMTREIHQLRAEVEHGRAVLEQALDASRTKTSFLLKVSHELRTPLNAVVGYTELLLEHDGRRPAELRADLERILGAAHDLLAVIDDVLDLARIEAGKYEVALTTFALADVIGEAIAAVSPLAERAGNRLKLRLSRELGEIRSDRTRLRQILVQLLGNACKFTRDGLVELSAEPQGETYVLAIRDTGAGIEPGFLPRLFTPFSQADESPTRRHGGLGIGLALCKRWCTLLGGEITVESAPGEGSTFRVQVPTSARDPREAGIAISVF